MLLYKVVSGSPKDSGCDVKSPALVAIAAQRLPADWRELSEAEFAQSMMFSYTPEACGYTQIMMDKRGRPLKGPCLGIHFFMFHDGTGIAMTNDFWEGKVRYFAFGCVHEYKEVYDGMRGRCLHTYECSKCGHRMTVDSSD